MESVNRPDSSAYNTLTAQVIHMTLPTNTNNRNSACATYEDYRMLRREKLRDRRLRTGSLISGQLLSLAPSDHLTELQPFKPNTAI